MEVDECLRYQLEFLKKEFDAIQDSIERIDGITQATKNWAVGTWAGSLGLLFNADREDLLILTAALPIVFWVNDAWWRRIQRSFIYRTAKIGEFLNKDLQVTIQTGHLTNFRLLDLRGWQYETSVEFKKFTSFFRTFWFKSVGLFYAGLIALSVIVHSLLN